MSRRMDVDGEIFRAVISQKKMVPNPDYDWSKGWRQHDENGILIPSSIPSETETFTTVLGPYARKSDATAQMNIFSKNGYGGAKHIVGKHVERAIVTWEVVE